MDGGRGKVIIKGLCKSYGCCTVFDNFDFEIPDGKVTCVLGESGAGKTTLLNVLAGLTPFTGVVPRKKCSYIFQRPALVPNLTVEGNLKLICKDGTKTANMLKRVGLEAKRGVYPAALSGGQAQRVAIARAFLYPAELVLMDEPFSSLDLKLKIEMMELFKSIAAESGRTAVFVTHDVDEALYLGDRIVVLSSGKIVFECENVPDGAFGCGARRAELVKALVDG